MCGARCPTHDVFGFEYYARHVGEACDGEADIQSHRDIVTHVYVAELFEGRDSLYASSLADAVRRVSNAARLTNCPVSLERERRERLDRPVPGSCKGPSRVFVRLCDAFVVCGFGGRS